MKYIAIAFLLFIGACKTTKLTKIFDWNAPVFYNGTPMYIKDYDVKEGKYLVIPDSNEVPELYGWRFNLYEDQFTQ